MRNLELVYEEVKLGVFIEGVSGTLYTADEWNSQENPNSIVILTESVSRRYALKCSSNPIIEYQGPFFGSLPIITPENAIYRIDGRYLTQQMHNAYSNNYATNYVNGFQFPDGKQNAYLPAAGELTLVFSNYTNYEKCANKVNGVNVLGAYWTSCYYGAYQEDPYDSETVTDWFNAIYKTNEVLGYPAGSYAHVIWPVKEY